MHFRERPSFTIWADNPPSISRDALFSALLTHIQGPDELTPADKTSKTPTSADFSSKKSPTQKKSRIPRLTALRALFYRKPKAEAVDEGKGKNKANHASTATDATKKGSVARKSDTTSTNSKNKHISSLTRGGPRARVQVNSAGSPVSDTIPLIFSPHLLINSPQSRSADKHSLTSQAQITPIPFSMSNSRLPRRSTSLASTSRTSAPRARSSRDSAPREVPVTLNRNVIGRASKLAASIMAAAQVLPQTDPMKALALQVAKSVLNSAEYAAMAEAHRIEAEAAAQLARLSEKTSMIEIKRMMKTLEGSRVQQFLGRLDAASRAVVKKKKK
jgi:hypothetical protein